MLKEEAACRSDPIYIYIYMYIYMVMFCHFYLVGGWGSESARMPPNGKFFWFLCVRDSEAGVFLVKSPPGARARLAPPPYRCGAYCKVFQVIPSPEPATNAKCAVMLAERFLMVVELIPLIFWLP